MFSKVLIMNVTFVLWLIHLSSVASYFKQGPECKDQYCGDVEISYPFGIGKNCSYDKWFQIDCKKVNNESTPYLKSIGLEVTRIYENTIVTLIPLNLSRYDGGYDLRETPFSFSGERNVFVGIGCNMIAYTSDYDLSVWCTSVCDSYSDPSNSNYYRGCVTELQQNIQTLNPVIASVEHSEHVKSKGAKSNLQKDASGFGVIVDRYSISQRYVGYVGNFENLEYVASVEGLSLIDTQNLLQYWFFRQKASSTDPNRPYFYIDTQVSVVLEWEFYDATSASLGVDDNTTFCEAYERWFRVNDSFYSNSSLQCFCKDGFAGNPYLHNGCQVTSYSEGGGYPEYAEPKHFSWKPVVTGVCSPVGALLFVLILWWLYKVVRREIELRIKDKYFKRNGGLLLQQQISSSDGNIEKTKVFSSYELEKATDHYNIDRVLGQGGQGTVYKGMLSDGRIVAVKKSIIADATNIGQFINEVVILSQINHRNVVKLLGCCLETKVPLLVYEFILNGTLFQHIHNPSEDFPLTWAIRLRICAEIAGALSYMHSAASLPIFHRDIKSTNILLDSKYKARVSDFGSSKSIEVDKTHFTTLVQGTFGYLDPEYFRSSQFTEKSDVYSFGVVLVELLTGQKPIFSISLQEFKGLASHFVELMEENKFLEMIDPQISKEGNIEEMVEVANLAKSCLDMNGKRRPTMKEVAIQLEGIRMSGVKNNPHDDYEKVIEDIEIDHVEGFDDSSASTTMTW